jgi:hypothetical protein
MRHLLSRATVVALTTAAIASAQDECTTAVAILANTLTLFDTSTATTGANNFPCSTAPHTKDIWFRYTATSNQDIALGTCGSSFDTLAQAYSGTCGALTSLICNDDSCGGGQSTLRFPGVSGQTYYIQVAGRNGASGIGQIEIFEVAPAPPCSGVSTVGYIAGNYSSPGGAVYFDLTVTSAVTIGGLLTHFLGVPNIPVGLTVHTTPITHVGNESNPAAWTQVAMDDGSALAGGKLGPTSITFASALNLAPGTYGIALVASPSAIHGFTNGNGTNQYFSSGVFSITAGSASNVPFAAPVLTPRVWNGELCEGVLTPPGTNYCAANPNSTGQTGLMSAAGTSVAASNNLTLGASRLPNNAFGYFLTSTNEAFTPNPGGSLGNLCLGGGIGRYTGPGQIKNSGGTGSFALLINLNQVPTPIGFVVVTAGDTRRFQCWHRDSVAGLAVSNFTDGYRVTFH